MKRSAKPGLAAFIGLFLALTVQRLDLERQ